MGEKDITQKTLEGYNDIFADIVNVLLFNGKEVIKPEELRDATSTSQYKAENIVRSQERDVAKYWHDGKICISTIGLENQTGVDADMPLRIIGYDGAAYRNQIKADEEARVRYPVVTLVLYFGDKPWNVPTNLLGRLTVPEELMPFVHDYDINLFQISKLTEEQISMFKSDFKEVAMLCANGDYPGDRDYVPKHPEELVQAMTVLAGDDTYEDVYSRLTPKEKEGGVSMGALGRSYREEGRKEERQLLLKLYQKLKDAGRESEFVEALQDADKLEALQTEFL